MSEHVNATNYPGYSVLMSVYRKEKPEHLRLLLDSVFNRPIALDGGIDDEKGERG